MDQYLMMIMGDVKETCRRKELLQRLWNIIAQKDNHKEKQNIKSFKERINTERIKQKVLWDQF